MRALIYKLIWLALYSLASVYATVCLLCMRLNAAAAEVFWSYDRWRRGGSGNHASSASNDWDNDRALLLSCRQHLSKLPRHVNIIVGPDDTQLDVTLFKRILTYALIMEIDCISLYDTRPANSSGERHVSVTQLSAPDGVQLEQLHQHHYRWTTVSAVAALNGNGKRAQLNTQKQMNGSTNGYINGATNGHCNSAKQLESSIEIFEITRQQGRPLVAEVCRKLFKQRHTPEIQDLVKDRTQLTERINKELSQLLHELPEPELSIVFNQSLCTFGMLPWQTRFTEYHLHTPGCPFDARTFAQLLFTYSRCEQRWGK